MKKLLNAVQAAGTGSPTQLECPKDNHGIEVVLTGSAASCTLLLEGSISGTIWFTLATLTFSSGELTALGKATTVKDKMVERVRANLTIYNSEYASRGTLTVSAIPATGDKVVIDTKTYTFSTTPATAEGSVKVEATAASAIQNLSLAITNGAGAGTKYSCAASHPSATICTLAAGSLIIRARTKGVAGDAIVTTGTGATLTFGHTHLRGGIDNGTVTAYYTPHPNRPE